MASVRVLQGVRCILTCAGPGLELGGEGRSLSYGPRGAIGG